MIKYLKSVGVLLFLSTVCNGTVYANQEGRKTDVRVTQLIKRSFELNYFLSLIVFDQQTLIIFRFSLIPSQLLS